MCINIGTYSIKGAAAVHPHQLDHLLLGLNDASMYSCYAFEEVFNLWLNSGYHTGAFCSISSLLKSFFVEELTCTVQHRESQSFLLVCALGANVLELLVWIPFADHEFDSCSAVILSCDAINSV